MNKGLWCFAVLLACSGLASAQPMPSADSNGFDAPRALPPGNGQPPAALPIPQDPETLNGFTEVPPPNGFTSPESCELCCPGSTLDCCTFNVRAEYLMWWMKKGPLPIPLVTTGSVVTNDPTTSSGPLGNPGTQVLFGESGLDYNSFSGGRLTADYWLDSTQTIGIQASGFVFDKRPEQFTASSDANGNPILARPIVDRFTGLETAELVSYPGALAGSITATSYSRLWGSEANGLYNLYHDGCWRADLIGGFRYVDLNESIGILQATTVLANGTAAFEGGQINTGDTLILADNFSTRNQFYGGQIGGRTEFTYGPWFVDLSGKVAIGSTHQVVITSGNTTLLEPGATPVTVTGGGLALQTNIGRTSHDEFGVIPEVGFQIGYNLTSNINVYLGYNLIYWSSVVRPGDQISRTVNSNFLPSSLAFNAVGGPADPSPQFHRTDFWAQGISFGLGLRF